MKENNKKRNTKVLSEEWFETAMHDLEAAKILFQEKHFTDTICFHLHQTIEKYLKGFLVFNNIKPPRTHDLSELLKMCSKIDMDFLDWNDECEILDEYYIESRYPPDAPVDYPRSEVKKSIEFTEQLIKFIKNKT